MVLYVSVTMTTNMVTGMVILQVVWIVIMDGTCQTARNVQHVSTVESFRFLCGAVSKFALFH